MAAVRPSEIPILQHVPGADHIASYLDWVAIPDGATLFREGDTSRDLYFILRGEGQLKRGPLEVGRFGPGDHLGELALLGGKPRQGTLTAATPMTLARLAPEHFDELCRDEPALALSLTRALMTTVGTWLTEMTQSVEELLRERSLPRRAKVTLRLPEGAREARTGTPVADLLDREIGGELVVAGLIDRRPVSLVTRISSDGEVMPLTTGHWEGNRIFRNSLGLLLLEAAERRFPELDVRLEHSIGVAQVVLARGDDVPAPSDLAHELEVEMRRLVADDVPLREEWWTVEEARTHFEQAGWTGAAALLGNWRDASAPLVSYGEVYAPQHGPMIPSSGMLAGFRILPDADGVLLVFGEQQPVPSTRRKHSTIPPQPHEVSAAEKISQHTRSMMRDHRRWLRAMGTTTVGEFNRACVDGKVTQLVRVSEGFQEKQIGRIADAVAERGEAVKVICIAGPSSSGKSTFIKRLRVQLQVNALFPVDLSLDDYYVDRDATPRDAHGDFDFEAFDALHVNRLQDHLHRLLAGEEITTAHFDFKKGISLPEGGRTLKLREGEILLIEGIHGLNPQLLSNIPSERVFRIYLCPLAQLPLDRLARVHASDLRLLRRIVRDRHQRGTVAADNIMRWPSVRRGERRHIFPFQQHADAVFDSSLIYELSVLKVFAERYLLEVPQSHAAYTTAFRLLRLLDRFVAIYPDHVPPTSILREFIGGSGFEY